jgi:putative transposase
VSQVAATIRSMPIAAQVVPAATVLPVTAGLPARPASTLVCHQAYRFALDPTPIQERALGSAVGASRFAFNWGLAHVKGLLDRAAAGEQVHIPWSLAALRKAWNHAKHDVAPWWSENSKEAYNTGLDGLAHAFSNYFASRDGTRAGRRVGFPRFRKRRRGPETVRFTTGAIRVEPDRQHVTLPRLGRVRTHESTRKLARRLEAGTARILAATVCRNGGRWFVSFTCEVIRTIPARPTQRVPRQVGVDLGVRDLAVLSTGERIPNPAPLQRARTRLRRLNRQLARRQGPCARDGSRRTPSAGWLGTKGKLGRVHGRVAANRADAVHQLTSRLARTSDVIVLEHLHLVGLTRRGRASAG